MIMSGTGANSEHRPALRVRDAETGAEPVANAGTFVDPLEPPVAAEVEGQLWASPWGWPALTAGAGAVRGVLVTLHRDRVEDALARLDAVEGVDTGLFERVVAQTSAGTVCSI
jgi:hypothetical protein